MDTPWVCHEHTWDGQTHVNHALGGNQGVDRRGEVNQFRLYRICHEYAMNIPNWPTYFWNFRNMPCFTQPDSTPSPPHVFLNQISYLGAALKGQFTSAELPHEPFHLCLSRVKCPEAWGNKEVTLNGMEGKKFIPWSIVFCRGTTAEQIIMSLSPNFLILIVFVSYFNNQFTWVFQNHFWNWRKLRKKHMESIWVSHCPPIPFRHLSPVRGGRWIWWHDGRLWRSKCASWDGQKTWMLFSINKHGMSG